MEPAHNVENDSVVRANLSTALANSYSPKALPHLLKTLNDTDAMVRTQTIQAIAGMAIEMKKPDLFGGIKTEIEKQLSREKDEGLRSLMASTLKCILESK